MNVQTIVRAAASAGLVVAITLGAGATAFAGPKAKSSQSTRVRGAIVAVDRDARTIVVRGDDDATMKVAIPEGSMIRLRAIGNLPSQTSHKAFEHTHVGIQVDLLVAPSAVEASVNGQ